MPKKYVPISIVAALLCAVAIIGYSLPATTQDMPVRILFDNSGGNTIFPHLVHHRDYSIPCAECHHERRPLNAPDDAPLDMAAPEDPMECGACHPISFDSGFADNHMDEFENVAMCTRCHHMEFASLKWDHEEHHDYAECVDCHHDEDIAPEPMACDACHFENDAGDGTPGVRNAAHSRCAECHDDMFLEKTKGCSYCHEVTDMSDYEGDFTSCVQCHYEPDKDLLLTRTDAFHDQCRNCHMEAGKGPFSEDDCTKCHIR